MSGALASFPPQAVSGRRAARNKMNTMIPVFLTIYQFFVICMSAAQSPTSKASNLLLAGMGLLSPCFTKAMVKAARITNTVA